MEEICRGCIIETPSELRCSSDELSQMSRASPLRPGHHGGNLMRLNCVSWGGRSKSRVALPPSLPGSDKQRNTSFSLPAIKGMSINLKSHLLELHIVYECDNSAIALVLLFTFSFR